MTVHCQTAINVINMCYVHPETAYCNGSQTACGDFLCCAQGQCRSKCLEDLQSTTRYVTWSLHTKSRSSLKQMLSKARAVAADSLQSRPFKSRLHAMSRSAAAKP